MPVYSYICRICEMEFEAERSIANRQDVVCPRCGDQLSAEIQLQPCHWKMGVTTELTTERAVIADEGSDWRENKESRRMKAREPKRLWGGAAKARS